MRYQQYKNRMMKVRKVLATLYHLRFVFLGVTTVVVAGAITLDVSKGMITETSEFDKTYVYGDEITYSGSAFMGSVSYEFRKKDKGDWKEEKPRRVGIYEARAKSMGNHGYKYSDISTFEITPYEVPISIKDDKVDFGTRKPKLEYKLLGTDRLDENYKISYADLTKNTTTANIMMESIRVYDKDNVDITDCYHFTPALDKEITFNKQNITVNFVQPQAVNYDGEAHGCDEIVEPITGSLWDNTHLEISGGETFTELGKHDNEHSIKVVDDEGKDYSDNYNIRIVDNSITINKRDKVKITSSSPAAKLYDGKPFDENLFTYEVEGLLPIHHVDVTFDHTEDFYNVGTVSNTFSASILDSENNDVSNYYERLDKVPGTLTINKREVTITSSSLNNQVFDNLPRTSEDFTYDASEYAENDKPVRQTTTEVTNPGVYENAQTYKIMHEDPTTHELTDVTSNYLINPVKGSITINKLPLRFAFDALDAPVTYDANPHNVFKNDNQGRLLPEYEANLPTGWTYDVAVYTAQTTPLTMKYYNEQGYTADESLVRITLRDALGNDVTDIFNIDKNPSHANDDECDITFEFGTSYISKRDLSIEFTDYGPKIYDDKTVENTLNIADLYTVTGLQGSDTVTVEYANNEQKSIRNVGEYSINFTYKVEDSSKENVAYNYNIDVVNDKLYSDLKINKKDITIHTPTGLSKVYDSNNTLPSLTGKVFSHDGPSDISVTPEQKQYTIPGVDVGTYTYDFSVDDISIKVGSRDVKDNYNINFVADGQVTILKRPLQISQTTDSKNFIFFDDTPHGVRAPNEKEVKVELAGADNNRGLLSNHRMEFDVTHERTEPGIDDFEASTANFGMHIYEGVTNDNEVTSNYDVEYVDSYIHINIIKKDIYVASTTANKVFDGSPLDLYPTYENNQFYPIAEMTSKQFVAPEITYFDPATSTTKNTTLYTGHRIMVTKTSASILEDTIEVGSYGNEFECKVIDQNNNDVSYFYNITKGFGMLTTEKLNITTYCDYKKKEYDGTNINASSGAFSVTESTKSKGAYLTYPKNTTSHPFDKNVFRSNFDIEATIASGSYPDLFKARNYSFTTTFKIYDKRGGGNVEYNTPANVTLNNTSSAFKYDVTKVDLKILHKDLGAGKEMRYISNGKIVPGDELRFYDDVWDQYEVWNLEAGKKKLIWNTEFANYRIYRGNVDVTDCYNITTA